MSNKDNDFSNVRLFHDRNGRGYTRLVDTETGEVSGLIGGGPHPIDRRTRAVAFVVNMNDETNETIAIINGAEYVAGRR